MLKYALVQLPITILGTLAALLFLTSAETDLRGARYDPATVYSATILLLLGAVLTLFGLGYCIVADVVRHFTNRRARALFHQETGQRVPDHEIRGL